MDNQFLAFSYLHRGNCEMVRGKEMDSGYYNYNN